MSPATVNPRNVAILIFDDAEVLDFAGPHEVFTVAGDLIRPPPFYVFEVALTPGPILARGRLLATPRYTIDDARIPTSSSSRVAWVPDLC